MVARCVLTRKIARNFDLIFFPRLEEVAEEAHLDVAMGVPQIY